MSWPSLWARPGELMASEWRTARRALTEAEQRLRAELATVPPSPGTIDISGAWQSRELVGRVV
jgi:hypothetical protein